MKIKTLFLALWTQLFVLTAYADITKNGDMFDVAEIGGVYYNLNGNEATVIARGDYQYSGAIVILSSFNYYGKTYAVTSIGRRAFFGCSNLTIVDIPNSIKSIGEGAFQGCSGLTSMDIPYSVTSIGGNAFKDCGKLTTIIIPQNVKSINDGVFQGCSGLTAIKIPESVTSIGSLAFSGCKSLSSIVIPSSVKAVNSEAFKNCDKLTTIMVDQQNTVYDSRDNCNAIIETATNTLIVGCSSTIIPHSVTQIGSNTFSGCRGLASITIPNSVRFIGDGAFSGCI